MLFELLERRKNHSKKPLIEPFLAVEFAQELEDYFSALVLTLHSYLDKRLVRTFQNLLGCIIRFRDRHNGLVLSELGGYLLGPPKSAAGTKRISNLFRSPKWSHKLIEDFLLERGKKRVAELIDQGVRPLLFWDESVVEKPESWYSEGLGAVRSSKAKRLKRIKPGYYSPPGGTIHVPGFNWMGIVLGGLRVEASILATQWWSSRGKARMQASTVRDNLIFKLAKAFADQKATANQVVHVLDRGFAGRPWLGKLFDHKQNFILRWPKRFLLCDNKGVEKNAWKLSTGRKSADHTTLKKANGTLQKIGMIFRPVTHPDWPEQQLYLLISRPGKGRKPWYLLTNLEIQTNQQAWEVIFSYARRWKVETMFRFAKAEMAMESPRLWFWENRLKCMMIISLAIDFILHLLQKGRTHRIKQLLKHWCPRTGNRCRKTSTPIFRIRLALSHCWNYFIIQNSG